MVNEKYIIVIDAADDAGMWPASGLAAVTCAGDGAVLVRCASGKAGDVIRVTAVDATAWLVQATLTMDGNPSSGAVINAG